MKMLFFVFALGITININAQSVVGKWKAASFSIDKLAHGNVATGQLSIDSVALRNLVKDDKDPGKTFFEMKSLFINVFEITKIQELRFQADGVYVEKSKDAVSGTYHVDTNGKRMTRLVNKEKEGTAWNISWKANHLVLTNPKLKVPKLGKLDIEYEPVK